MRPSRPAAGQRKCRPGPGCAASPDAEIGHFQLAFDDGCVQAGFRFGAELPVDQVGGLRDDHGRGDQGALIALQQHPAGRVVSVGAIGRRDQRAGIHDQHLVAPEALGQHLIRLCRAPPGSGGAHRGEGQPAAGRLGQLSRRRYAPYGPECRISRTARRGYIEDNFLGLLVNAYVVDYRAGDVLRYFAQEDLRFANFQPQRRDKHEFMLFRFSLPLLDCWQCGEPGKFSIVPLASDFLAAQETAGDDEIVSKLSVQLLRHLISTPPSTDTSASSCKKLKRLSSTANWSGTGISSGADRRWAS